MSPKSGNVGSAPMAQPSATIQDALSRLGRDHSTVGERQRLLLTRPIVFVSPAIFSDRLRLELACEDPAIESRGCHLHQS
jgi:hypothetical protein